MFLLAVWLLFLFLLPKYRAPMILVASYLFYATWSIPYIAVILFTTTVDYWMSRVIDRSDNPLKRKCALTFGLIINLLVLAYYKYGLLHWFGWELNIPPEMGALGSVLNVILPLGISFYTFEAISYMMDVYRGHEPAKNWLDYNFYIMYFPHLISGPIIRYGELWLQYKEPLKLPSLERLAKGFELILLGYCFKVLIADYAAKISDPVFASPETVGVLVTYAGVLAFTVQIYFDFMGYTHIARGVSLLLNIEMPLNFNHPYHAQNISDFWARWHMSLSRWIRDYLYFPLGGSRCSQARTLFNLMTTMLICGAWHGAGWTYVVWGGWHGLLLCVYHVYKTSREKLGVTTTMLSNRYYDLASMGITFMAVVAGWVFFRATDFANAAAVFANLGNVGQALGELSASGSLKQLAIIALLLLCCWVGPLAVRVLEGWYRPLPYWAKVQVACVAMLLCWVASAENAVPFIYFQF